MPHVLPPLPYDFNALEPHIDEQTMRLHHGKHHQTYVDKLNAALQKYPEWAGKPLDEVLRKINEVPEAIRTEVRNHGGGHANHSAYWASMSPRGGGDPTGGFAKKITASFGSIAEFREQFTKAAAGIFGSGWAWLVEDNGALRIETRPNQDSPLMDGHIPLLGLDVWEHAYYLKYQNRRADYINAWWNVVDWESVAAIRTEGGS